MDFSGWGQVGFAEISARVTLIHRSTFHPKKEQIAANIGSEEGGVMTITHAPLVPLKLSSQCAYLTIWLAAVAVAGGVRL